MSNNVLLSLVSSSKHKISLGEELWVFGWRSLNYSIKMGARRIVSSLWRTLLQVPVLLFLLIFVLSGSTSGTRVLSSPSITTWGDWGPMERCGPGTYVIGMQLKVEPKQPAVHDDTGLNGIRFFCSELSGSESVKSTIQSTVGPWGSWRSEFFCNGVVVGFQLRSEPSQRDRDDTAANNLRLFCSDETTMEGEGTLWGDWTSEQRCRKRQAVCGLQTQVEMSQGYGKKNIGNVTLIYISNLIYSRTYFINRNTRRGRHGSEQPQSRVLWHPEPCRELYPVRSLGVGFGMWQHQRLHPNHMFLRKENWDWLLDDNTESRPRNWSPPKQSRADCTGKYWIFSWNRSPSPLAKVPVRNRDEW